MSTPIFLSADTNDTRDGLDEENVRTALRDFFGIYREDN